MVALASCGNLPPSGASPITKVLGKAPEFFNSLIAEVKSLKIIIPFFFPSNVFPAS